MVTSASMVGGGGGCATGWRDCTSRRMRAAAAASNSAWTVARLSTTQSCASVMPVKPLKQTGNHGESS